MTQIAKKTLFPEMHEVPAVATPPDVVLDGDVLRIALALPFHHPVQLSWTVDAHLLRVRGRVPSVDLDLTIPLPAPVHPGRYIIRENGGVYEIEVERRRRDA